MVHIDRHGFIGDLDGVCKLLGCIERFFLNPKDDGVICSFCMGFTINLGERFE